MDLDKERARLAKEIEKLEKNLQQIQSKLSNEKFISNAPDEVIEEQRNRQEEAEAALGKLSLALKQIEAA